MKIEHIVSEKMLDTDYVNLDDTHTAEMLSSIRQSFNGGGWGLARVLECCGELCSSVFTLLGGLALTVSLFVIKVPATEGEILLNGIDIRKYNYREYMDIFSVVFQDFKLLSLKLGENIAGKVDYDKDLVIDCLEKAGFADRLFSVDRIPDTYEDSACYCST